MTVGEDGLELELARNAAPCAKQARWFVDGAIDRISVTRYPDDARWYARVISEGRVAVGDRVEVEPAPVAAEPAPVGAEVEEVGAP